jgi:hypothetical protein
MVCWTCGGRKTKNDLNFFSWSDKRIALSKKRELLCGRSQNRVSKEVWGVFRFQLPYFVSGRVIKIPQPKVHGELDGFGVLGL